ncbi:uncharacterized protein LOC127831710 isoform X2 [Dreissena polymorpha]|uniref:Uncharacterized protein n=1 Tax=Dreissena polymorpha TaxID=45954 RepID=A0A9D4GJH2_DREPO|nr:uncharacterized protein LOC127831710 isoform X2 [Dreissena polymorpha]KAH3818018.1 hypothetical protein DPMN_119605 [Dreissena polymorpha]
MDLLAQRDFSPEDHILISKWLNRWTMFVSEEQTANTIVSLSHDVVARGKTIDLSQKKRTHKNKKGTAKPTCQQLVLKNTSDELHDPNNTALTDIECEYNRDGGQIDICISTNHIDHSVGNGNAVHIPTLLNTGDVLQSANNLNDCLTTEMISTDDATQYINNLDNEHMPNLFDTECVVQSVNYIGDEQTNLLGTDDVMQSDNSGDDEQTLNIMPFPENEKNDSIG